MTGSYVKQNRQRLRDAIVSAARELTVASGWEAVRMADVAARVGVSRQTVYNEFAGKAGLAEALVRHEVEPFLAGVRSALLAHGDDIRAGAYAAISFVLTEAAGNPLVKAILTTESDPLLPYLSSRSDVVLGAATGLLSEWAAACLPAVDAEAFAVAAESVVRLVLSHIVLPLAPVDVTAAQLADVATVLVDGLGKRLPLHFAP